jgi:hypothetical protein
MGFWKSGRVLLKTIFNSEAIEHAQNTPVCITYARARGPHVACAPARPVDAQATKVALTHFTAIARLLSALDALLIVNRVRAIACNSYPQP